MTGLVSTIGRLFAERSSAGVDPRPIRGMMWFANPEWCAAVAHLLSEGYCVVKKAVDDEIVNDAVAAYQNFKKIALLKYADKVDAGGYEAGKFRRLVNLPSAIPEMARLFTGNRTLEMLDALFGSPATLYTSLTFEIGSGQNPHRDTPYFWTGPAYNYFGLWTALEPTDSQNGALKVVPRSHLIAESMDRRREIGNAERNGNGRLASDSPRLWNKYQEDVNEQAAKMNLRATEVHVDRGDAIIWHPQLLHGGAEALDKNRSRLSIAMHVTPKNVTVFQQNIFFDPEASVAQVGKFHYSEVDGRDILTHNEISIAHQVSIPLNTLR